MSSVVDVLCAEIQKSIERLNKSRLTLIKCTQMLKEYHDKNFLSDKESREKLEIIGSLLDNAVCLLEKVIE